MACARALRQDRYATTRPRLSPVPVRGVRDADRCLSITHVHVCHKMQVVLVLVVVLGLVPVLIVNTL